MTDTSFTIAGVTYYRQGPTPQTIEGHFPLSYVRGESICTLLVRADNLEAAKLDLERLCDHWSEGDKHYTYTPTHLSKDKQASKFIDSLIDQHGNAPEHPLLVDLGYQLLKIKQELDRRLGENG